MYLSRKERNRRYKQLRLSMAQKNIEVLLVIGNNHATGNAFFATGSFRYLTDFFIKTLYGMLLFFREWNPIMFVPTKSQVFWGKKHSWIDDVRTGSNYAEMVVRILRERGLAEGKVGIVSMESIPTSIYFSLREGLPNVEFVDASSILLPLRFIKSDEERRLMQIAAEMNDGAYKEVLKKIRPGIKEHEIVGILEGYQRGNGADRTFNLISSGTFPTSKKGIPFHGIPWCPSQREIKKGDCIHLEITTNYGGYWNQLVRIVSVGYENSELHQFQKAAVMTIEAGLKKIQVGTKTVDFVSSMAKTLERYGFELTTPMGHFLGIDLIEARVDSESKVILVPGIAMILHPCISSLDGINIILWGQTYFMTEKGPVRLNQTNDILHTV
jgi:Xaa-Pro aminopeptidase